MEIIINTNIFTIEQKEHIEPQLRELIIELSVSLNITSLKQVIIPENFTEEVIEFQKAHNKHELGHRDSDDARTFAKVITFKDFTGFSQVIFIHEAFIAALYNKEKSKDIMHYIQHELGHIHDNYYTQNIFTSPMINETSRITLEVLLQEHSEIIWSEYFANRSSFSSSTYEIIMSTVDNVKSNIELVKEQSQVYIEEFKQNRDTTELINNLRQSTDLLFYYTAHLLGFLHPLKEKWADSGTRKSDRFILSQISQTFYLQTWNRIDKALLELYKKYPDWKDIHELDRLNEAVLQCWEELGVTMYMEDSEIIVNVQ